VARYYGRQADLELRSGRRGLFHPSVAFSLHTGPSMRRTSPVRPSSPRHPGLRREQSTL